MNNKDLDNLVSKIPFNLVADPNSRILYIILKVPVAAQEVFTNGGRNKILSMVKSCLN